MLQKRKKKERNYIIFYTNLQNINKYFSHKSIKMSLYIGDLYKFWLKEIKFKKLGVNENIYTDDTTPLLYYALRDRKYHIADELIALGADVNFTNTAGYSLLSCAILNKQYDCAKKLIKLGASINFIQENGHSAAIEIARTIGQGDKEDVQPCIEIFKMGMDVNVAHYKTGNTALHYSMTCSAGVTIVLFKLKANINALNKDGKTPLDMYFEKNGMIIYNYMANLYFERGARTRHLHCESAIWCAYMRNVDKASIAHILRLKSRFGANGGVLCKLPVELIQILEFMLCGISA